MCSKFLLVLSSTTFPVFNVDPGSKSNTWTSFGATGICSTLAGIMIISPSSNQTSLPFLFHRHSMREITINIEAAEINFLLKIVA